MKPVNRSMGPVEWSLLVTLSVLWGGSFFFVEIAVDVLPPQLTATGQVTASTVILIPLAIAVEQPWRLPMPGLEVWAAVSALALFSTALAYILYFSILATAGATNLLLVTFLIPVSAIVLGISILGEQLALKHFAGMALIGLGLAAIDGRALGFLRGRLAAKPT